MARVRIQRSTRSGSFAVASIILAVLATTAVVTVTDPGGAPDVAQIWVSDDANGDLCQRQSPPGAYDSATDCSSFDAAEAISQPGDTIFVTCSTGTSCSLGAQTVTGTAAVTDKVDVTLKPEPGETVNLTGTLRLATVDDLVIEGLLLSNSASNQVEMAQVQRVELRHNEMIYLGSSLTAQAIVMSGSCSLCHSSEDVRIIDNYIDRNTFGDGVDYIHSGGRLGALGTTVIQGNLIDQYGEDGIHFDAETPDERVQVIDNVFRDATKQDPGAHNDGIQITRAPELDIKRNVMDGAQHGIVISDVILEGPDVVVENNYLLGNGSGTMLNGGDPCSSLSYIRNNTSMNATTYDVKGCNAYVAGNVFMDTPGTAQWGYDGENYNVFFDPSGWTLGANSVRGQSLSAVFQPGTTSTANVYPPRVVAAWPDKMTTTVDPRLKCGTSPAVGRAHPTNVPATDLLGRTRATPDGGAYECLPGDP